MKPITKLAETRTPDGTVFALYEHDGNYSLHYNSNPLMSTGLTVSEQMLSDIGCDFPSRPAHPHVLIGGLGLGYSLKRVLEIIGKPATVRVAELLPEVVAWNREFLSKHNGPLLDDPRTAIHVGDVFDCIRDAEKRPYDSIMLDTDDGPGSLVLPQNVRLYRREGLEMIQRALTPNGRVAFWLACPEPRLLKDMARVGFKVSDFPAKAHVRSKRAAHRIYLGERQISKEGSGRRGR
jgi:spermidine synthase